MFAAPAGWNPLECCDEIWRQKTRIVELPDGEEIMTGGFLHFDTIPARDWQTDGQTDGQADRQTRYDRKDPH